MELGRHSSGAKMESGQSLGRFRVDLRRSLGGARVDTITETNTRESLKTVTKLFRNAFSFDC